MIFYSFSRLRLGFQWCHRALLNINSEQLDWSAFSSILMPYGNETTDANLDIYLRAIHIQNCVCRFSNNQDDQKELAIRVSCTCVSTSCVDYSWHASGVSNYRSWCQIRDVWFLLSTKCIHFVKTIRGYFPAIQP